MAKHVFGLDFINSFSGAEELHRRRPEGMDPIMQYIEEQKSIEKEIGVLGKFHNDTGWTRSGRMQRVASIPQALAGAIKQLDPEVFEDKRKFYAWLDANPEYDMRQKVGA
jgi:hypothetical protein